MTLLYDTPILDPADDALGRAPFATSLAAAILSMDADSGFVFGIHGPWGTGKTTTLNFILHELAASDADPPTIIRFNPWWFSGRDQLVQQFFNAFRSQLGGPSGTEQVAALSRSLDRFGRVLTPLTLVPAIAEPVRSLRTLLTGVSESSKAIAETMASDAQAIRREIDERLRTRTQRILVVIDDLDRLPAIEIRQIFQLVKAVADFPKTLYLLAYDRALVSRALESEQGGFGEDYLAKIVQAPFDLPPPPRSALDQLLLRQLDQVLRDTPDELFNQVAWGNLFMDGIQPLISTPRDVKRLINAVRPSYPPVRREVSAHEFVAIQAIRVFAPSFYMRMAVAKDLLAGYVPGGSGRGDIRDRWRSDMEAMLTSVREDRRPALNQLMRRLFPRWEFAFGGSAYGPDWLAGWRREARVCSPDVFDLYFRLALPDETIGLEQFRELIALAEQPDQLADRLKDLAAVRLSDGRSKVRVFLEGVQDFTADGIPLRLIAPFLLGLWRAGDALLIASDEGGMFSVGNDMQMMRITHQLLQRVDDGNERYRILAGAIAQDSAIELATREISVRYQGLEEHPDDEADHLTREQLDALRDQVLGRIRSAAETGALGDLPGLGYVLYRWHEWEENAAVEWARELGKSDNGFVRLVKAFSGRSWSHAMTDRVAKVRWRVRLDGLETFVGLPAAQLELKAKSILAAQPPGLTRDDLECLKILASGQASRKGME